MGNIVSSASAKSTVGSWVLMEEMVALENVVNSDIDCCAV